MALPDSGPDPAGNQIHDRDSASSPGARFILLRTAEMRWRVRLIAQDLLAVDPVHLDRAARPVKWLMAMPGIVAAPEANQGPIFWRHFDDEVIEIRARAEQPEAAAGPLPSRVHVDQNGDDFACRVGMDLTVLLRTSAPHREHDRPATQVDSELALERLPHDLPSQLLDQGSERRTVR